MSFFVFQCRNLKCGRWGTREVRKLEKARYKCVYCNKTKQIKKKDSYGLELKFHGPYNYPSKASEVCKELNKPLETKQTTTFKYY